MPESMNVLFLGVNDVGMRIYDWLCDREGVTVRALVTEPDQLGIVEDLIIDLIVSVGFDHLVPPDVLAVPKQGAINLHPSLLPHNRGKSPNVWSIVENTPPGVTLHYMDSEFDTGDIISQQEIDTSFADTGRDLHERLESAQFDVFTEVWPAIEGGEIRTRSQNVEEGTYHSTQDFLELCELDPNETTTIKEILDRLRALTFPPFDNARISVDGESYYVAVDVRHESEDRGERPAGLLTSYKQDE